MLKTFHESSIKGDEIFLSHNIPSALLPDHVLLWNIWNSPQLFHSTWSCIIKTSGWSWEGKISSLIVFFCFFSSLIDTVTLTGKVDLKVHPCYLNYSLKIILLHYGRICQLILCSYFFSLQEKPLTKSLQRSEDPQFDQVSTLHLSDHITKHLYINIKRDSSYTDKQM